MIWIIEKAVNFLNRQKISYDTKDMLPFEEYKAEKIICHTYRFGDFGRKQAFSIKSFLATQDMKKVELWLWLDAEHGYEAYCKNQWIKPLLGFIKVKKYSIQLCIGSSQYQKYKWIFDQKKKLAYRADGFRLWALNEYGGLYFDLDVMFLKNFIPLLTGKEFVSEWEYQPYANNAIIYLRKGSAINEYLMHKVKRHLTVRPWIIFKYSDRKLKYLVVYPCEIFDPLWKPIVTKTTNGLPIDTFKGFFEFQEAAVSTFHYTQWFKEIGSIYAYHWHNCWDASVHEHSFFSLFEKQFEVSLGI